MWSHSFIHTLKWGGETIVWDNLLHLFKNLLYDAQGQFKTIVKESFICDFNVHYLTFYPQIFVFAQRNIFLIQKWLLLNIKGLHRFHCFYDISAVCIYWRWSAQVFTAQQYYQRELTGRLSALVCTSVWNHMCEHCVFTQCKELMFHTLDTHTHSAHCTQFPL